MRQPNTMPRPTTRSAMIVITPDRPLTAHEFAVRVDAVLNSTSLVEDERRVNEVEAGGHPMGTGPHYERGVIADEVGKPS